MKGRETLTLYKANAKFRQCWRVLQSVCEVLLDSCLARFLLHLSYKFHEIDEGLALGNYGSGCLSMGSIASGTDVGVGNAVANMELHIILIS